MRKFDRPSFSFLFTPNKQNTKKKGFTPASVLAVACRVLMDRLADDQNPAFSEGLFDLYNLPLEKLVWIKAAYRE